MLIAAGVASTAAALFYVTHLVTRRYNDRIRRLEEEWMVYLRHGLSNEFLFVDPTRLRKVCRLLPIGGFAGSLFTVSVFPFLVSLIGAWVVPYGTLRIIQIRRRNSFEKQFGAVLPQIASALRAGHTLERALDSLIKTQPNPLAQEFTLVLKEMRMGNTMDEALLNLLKRFPGRDLEMLVQATAISRRVGSSLAEVFTKVSDMIRARTKLRDRLSALTAQGRIQAWVAMAMPCALLVTLKFVAPDYLEPLFQTKIGHATLAISFVMMMAGGYWIHRISRMELLR